MTSIYILPSAKTYIQLCIKYAESEFGKLAAERWYEELYHLFHRLSIYPESSPREPYLQDYLRTYRSAIIRKNFKFIYRYDKDRNQIIVVDLWDMRMKYQRLLRQFRRRL